MSPGFNFQYLKRKICKYILLRLNAALSEGDIKIDLPIISVEHVLPQNPSPSSEWSKKFTPEKRERYTHKIGNLVLLSRNKNSSARNYDFLTKKQRYFVTRTGSSPFALTSQLLLEKQWTPESIEKKQKLYIQKLKDVWRLG